MNVKYLPDFILIFVFLERLVMSVAFVPIRTRCDGKHTLPLRNPQIRDKLFSQLLCHNCNATSKGTILTNDGDWLVIDLIYDKEEHIPSLSNGPMKGKGTYRFKQINFNWIGKTNEIWDFNDVKFPAELHVVFYNPKYGEYTEAVKHNDAVAILSMAFRVRPNSPSTRFLSAINDFLQNVTASKTNIAMPVGESLRLDSFLPQSLEYYYTYSGSNVSTLAPWEDTCKATIIWIDLELPLKIHPDQVSAFEKLLTYGERPQISSSPEYVGPNGLIYRSINLNNGNGQLNCGSYKEAFFTVACVLLVEFVIVLII
ncbi:carbonic anhydrase 2-like [Musca autumnalis]|uniref:carbonic anhydrase 2-like n=1 Tax=Musca autumnalis TaxID=221902 RepID=UPI003CF04FF3